MHTKNLARFFLFASIVPALIAQAPAAPPTPPAAATPTAPQAARRTPQSPPSVVAGIPVNYDEAKVGTYTLADPLLLDNGKPVKNAKTWWTKRRPEIEELFETQQYGRDTGRPADESFNMTDKGTPALDGKAIRKQVTISFSKDPGWPQLHLLIYLPANAHKPVPMFFSFNFSPIQCAVDDPGITPKEVWDPRTNTKVMPPQGRCFFGRIPVDKFLDAGIGVATYYYGEIDPDSLNEFPYGIRAKYLKPGQAERAPDDWGSIAAWAWGMSRAEDYFETDPAIDAKRVAIHGVSRLGKTVMWAGAHDQRFAAVIASCSGEGGAALSHRDYGETIAHLTAPTRYPYQFAENYAHWGGFPDKAPMDANLLIALIASRPLLLQTGNADYWSDPKGEFLAEVAAGPVYKLLGKDPLDTDVWPEPKVPILHDLAYYMHEGPHGMVPTDWDIYLEFLKMHLRPEQ
ncbi:putative acetyl xylan esterase [Candidatus Sulfotelmatomonas gaucii]|uniref:Putative acetyl xylan esterase n=1 Tax=Candidatus Sulfuritelmatomonas gaucii TaxID=2043161 RepID=A0A2N9LVB6_9BACT|nr:putative acetyl xylan esterase [Candidatus Sulfotelmatomonas gaucii]